MIPSQFLWTWAVLGVCALAACAQTNPAPPAPDGMKLAWSDEFDQEGNPDPKNWTFETGYARNEEDQWYQSDNATVKNGLLVIEAKREQKPN
ncbi:hypothetical protein EON80_32700, partial [bacterium]